mmetsp:Transcript_9792/g.14447  ORF Transcript_9792/g.14447 Transcript_9792/m.14447 type:complete len:288 (-) Transcript_9792:16-879(-)
MVARSVLTTVTIPTLAQRKENAKDRLKSLPKTQCVIVIGDTNCGKTIFVKNYIRDSIRYHIRSHRPTHFFEKHTATTENFDIDFYDFGGSKDFHEMQEAFLKYNLLKQEPVLLYMFSMHNEHTLRYIVEYHNNVIAPILEKDTRCQLAPQFLAVGLHKSLTLTRSTKSSCISMESIKTYFSELGNLMEVNGKLVVDLHCDNYMNINFLNSMSKKTMDIFRSTMESSLKGHRESFPRQFYRESIPYLCKQVVEKTTSLKRDGHHVKKARVRSNSFKERVLNWIRTPLR